MRADEVCPSRRTLTLRRGWDTEAWVVRGVFQREFLEIIEGAVSVESRNPVFQCKHKALPNVTVGDVIEFEGLSWSVQSVQPDGREVVTLALERCA